MKRIALIFAAASFLALGSCDKKTEEPNEPQPGVELTKLYEAYAPGSGLKLEYYALENPYVGYNKIYFNVIDSASGEKTSHDVNIEINPIMDMGMMMHSSPKEAFVYHSESSKYKGAVVYVMPSTAGDWYLNASVHDMDNGKEGTATFTPDVTAPDEARMFSFVSALDSTASYFVSLVEPRSPKVGENDFQILINRRASMMDWPFEPYLMVEIEPEMPSMNHGSPNNVDPTHIGEGHYSGVTNFTMTGWWRINMTIKDSEGNILTEDSYLDITFE